MYQILVAEAEAAERQALCACLEKRFADRCTVLPAGSGSEAVELFEQYRPQVAVLDMELPGLSGLEAARRIRQSAACCAIVFLTDRKHFSAAREAILLRALDCQPKPWSERELTAQVEEALRLLAEYGAVQEACLLTGGQCPEGTGDYTSLRMKHFSIGEKSKTDVALVYINGVADGDTVSDLQKRLSGLKTESLTMGHQSLTECLIGKRWYNPFPKVRTTERPDAACAQLLEGHILIVVDNSPEVMILPTTIFDFMQETGDFYFPPMTGTYIRLLRHVVFWLTLFMVPLWLLFVKNPDWLSSGWSFLRLEETGELPLIAQLFLVEFIIDVLRLASMNTPNMLTNSLSVVGGLILGEFAVEAGWLISEVILLMSFVAIANFTQRSLELGYAFKFMRMLMLILVELFGVWGFAAGLILSATLLCTNRTITPKYSYLYPLIPFNGRALASLLLRFPKSHADSDKK